jgi:predicted DNA-binding transcriptional regulator YafY
VRLDYLDRVDITSLRTVEPHRLVYAGQRWYLVAFGRPQDIVGSLATGDR